METNKAEAFDFKDLARYALKHFYIVIVTLILAITGSVIYTKFIQTPLYRSEAKLVLINANATSTSNLTNNDIALSNNLVKTNANIIKSRNVVDQVIDNLHLNASYEEIARQISVATTTDTQILTLQVSTPSALDSHLIAEELSGIFKQEVIKIYGIDNVQIIDKASLPEEPYNVNLMRQVLIGAAIGLAAGLGIIFLIFSLDTSIKSSENIEDQLQLVSFGAVPIVSGTSRQNMGKKRRSLRSDTADLMVLKNPKSPFAESIRSIKTNISFSPTEKGLKMISITSPRPGNGKSFIAANLATAFAQDGRRVLIIDADMRKGRQHRIFDIKNSRVYGYSNLILKFYQQYDSSKRYGFIRRQSKDGEETARKSGQTVWSDYIEPTKVSGVYLLPAGPNTPNPVGLLSSGNNQRLLTALKKEFDLIIIDCPPALGFADAIIESKYCDCNLVVVTSGKTKIDQLKDVKRAFDKVDSNITGVILNCVKKNGTEYSYQYGKKYYYSDDDQNAW